jgi:hypothetical protein
MGKLERLDRAWSASGISLLGAVITFLAMWGGVVLLLTDPRGPQLPPTMTTPRDLLVSLLLFWIPTITGIMACVSGVAGLSAARGHHPELQRRAWVGIGLGVAPICLAAAWLGWLLIASF